MKTLFSKDKYKRYKNRFPTIDVRMFVDSYYKRFGKMMSQLAYE